MKIDLKEVKLYKGRMNYSTDKKDLADLSEARSSKEKENATKCTKCAGQGYDLDDIECKTCKGLGYIENKKKNSIHQYRSNAEAIEKGKNTYGSKDNKKQTREERIDILVMAGYKRADAESQADEDIAKGKETK